MIQAKCILKLRNKNDVIIGYRLQDENGQIVDVKPHLLKEAIKAKKINVTNLKLSKDNKLIDNIEKINNDNNKTKYYADEHMKQIEDVENIRKYNNEYIYNDYSGKIKSDIQKINNIKNKERLLGVKTKYDINIENDKIIFNGFSYNYLSNLKHRNIDIPSEVTTIRNGLYQVPDPHVLGTNRIRYNTLRSNLREICESAFFEINFVDINFPDCIKLIRYRAFSYCNFSSLNLDYKGLIIQKEAFKDCFISFDDVEGYLHVSADTKPDPEAFISLQGLGKGTCIFDEGTPDNLIVPFGFNEYQVSEKQILNTIQYRITHIGKYANSCDRKNTMSKLRRLIKAYEKNHAPLPNKQQIKEMMVQYSTRRGQRAAEED